MCINWYSKNIREINGKGICIGKNDLWSNTTDIIGTDPFTGITKLYNK